MSVFALVVASLLLSAILLGASSGATDAVDDAAVQYLLEQGVEGIGMAVLPVLYVHYHWSGRSELDRLRVHVPSRREWLFVAVGLGVAVLISHVVRLVASTPTSLPLGTPVVTSTNAELAYLGAAVLFSGPAQELLFRRAVQGRLREVFGPAVAITLASALFVAVHVPGYVGPFPPGYGVELLAAGILLGILYEATDNVVVPALVHGLYNGLPHLLLLLQMSV